MEEASNVLFSLFGLEITKPVVATWAIIAALALLSLIAVRKPAAVPGALQNLAELAIEKLESFFADILGYEQMRRLFPLCATFFIFIVVSNYSGLLPGAGHLFAVPTASLSVTAALALITFFATHTVGIRNQGLGGYLKSFLKPVAVILPLTLLEQLVRPFSLALRLYGNMYGEEKVMEQLAEMFPVGLPLVMQVLSLMFCLIQAIVFTMLFAIYLSEAIGEDEHEKQ